MKILVAIPSSNNAKVLEKRTLLWAPRAGFKTWIALPNDEHRPEYEAAIDEANYQEFLDGDKSMIVTCDNLPEHAKSKGFDLLLVVPDDLSAWNATKDTDTMVIEYAADVARARKTLSHDPDTRRVDFDNGAIMVRL